MPCSRKLPRVSQADAGAAGQPSSGKNKDFALLRRMARDMLSVDHRGMSRAIRGAP